MKKFKIHLFSMVAISAALTLALAAGAFSQSLGDGCVKCVGAGQGWVCMSGAGGGDACTTSGYDCTLVNPCPSLHGAACSPGAGDPAKPRIILNIPDEIIREVGRSNPRLALTLITLRKLPPVRYSQGMVHSAPIAVTQADVEEHLAANSDYRDQTARFRERSGEALKKGLAPTVYNFSVQPSAADPNIYVLRIQTADAGSLGSPASLEINLSETADATRNPKDPTRVLSAGTWKIE